LRKLFVPTFLYFVFVSVSGVAEECSYSDKKDISYNKDSIGRATILISKSDCYVSNIELRVHSTKNKPLYISESRSKFFLGKYFASARPKEVERLASQFLESFVQPKPIKLLASHHRCLLWIPNSYYNKLIQSDAVMFSHNIRTAEVRYISYIPEIDQMVVIAQCTNKGA
jgi:hypothetical protein